MDVTFALLCDAANTTADGRLNILGQLDLIGSKSFPAVVPILHLVIRLSASPAEAGTDRDASIRILDEDGEIVGEAKGRIWVPQPSSPGRPSQLHLIQPFVNVSFERPGRHAFHILVGGDEKAVVPLDVVQSLADSEAEHAD